MPDEPTMEEMLQALEAMYFEWFSNGPKSMPIEGKHKEIYQAIRARIECKVSRERLKEIAKTMDRHDWTDILWKLTTMLKELGYEVDNA